MRGMTSCRSFSSFRVVCRLPGNCDAIEIEVGALEGVAVRGSRTDRSLTVVQIEPFVSRMGASACWYCLGSKLAMRLLRSQA